MEREQQRNKATTKQELMAYLVQGNEPAVALPTDDLLVALDRIRAGKSTQGHPASANREAVSAFLQTLKDVMQDGKPLPPKP